MESDIKDLTKVLEEKEEDLELAATIGQQLLSDNNRANETIFELELELTISEEIISKLQHDIQTKTDLLHAYHTNEQEDDSLAQHFIIINENALQKKILSLERENKKLIAKASKVLDESKVCEGREKKLICDAVNNLVQANIQIQNLHDQAAEQTSEQSLKKEEIEGLQVQVSGLKTTLKQHSQENGDLITNLRVYQKTQDYLTLELTEMKEKCKEVEELLKEAQVEIKRERRRNHPHRGRTMTAEALPASSEIPDSEEDESECSASSYVKVSTLQIDPSLQPTPSVDCTKYSTCLDSTQLGNRLGNEHVNGCILNDKISCTVQSHHSTDGWVTVEVGHISEADPFFKQIPILEPSPKSDEKHGLQSTPGHTFIFGSSSEPDDLLDTKFSSIAKLKTAFSDGSENSAARVFNKNGICQRIHISPSEQKYETKENQNLNSKCEKGDSEIVEGKIKYVTGRWISDQDMHKICVPRAMTGCGGYLDNLPRDEHIDRIMSNIHNNLRCKLKIVKPLEGSATLHKWTQLATPHLGGVLEEQVEVVLKGDGDTWLNNQCEVGVNIQNFTLPNVLLQTKTLYTQANKEVTESDLSKTTNTYENLKMSSGRISRKSTKYLTNTSPIRGSQKYVHSMLGDKMFDHSKMSSGKKICAASTTSDSTHSTKDIGSTFTHHTFPGESISNALEENSSVGLFSSLFYFVKAAIIYGGHDK